MARIHVCGAQAMELEVFQSLAKLSELAEAIGHGRLTLYVFGSATRDDTDPEDIDVLAIYDDPDLMRRFRRESEQLDLTRPLHLIGMTSSEETHYRFLDRISAKPISSATFN